MFSLKNSREEREREKNPKTFSSPFTNSPHELLTKSPAQIGKGQFLSKYNPNLKAKKITLFKKNNYLNAPLKSGYH